MMEGVDNEGKSESDPLFRSSAEIQNYPCVRKNPDNLRHRHGWCSGGDISARGRGHAHPGRQPMWAALPVQIPKQDKSATTFCFFEDHEIIPTLREWQWLLMDR